MVISDLVDLTSAGRISPNCVFFLHVRENLLSASVDISQERVYSTLCMIWVADFLIEKLIYTPRDKGRCNWWLGGISEECRAASA